MISTSSQIKLKNLIDTLNSTFRKRQKYFGGGGWFTIIYNVFPFLKTLLRTSQSQFSQGGSQRKTLI